MAWPLAGFPSAGFPRAGAKDFPGDGLVNEALATLRRPGVTSNVWIAGANGVSLASLASNNYLLADFATLAGIDAVVGGLKNAMNPAGGNNLTQATTANKPLRRRGLYNLLPQSATLTNVSWATAGAVVTGADNKVALPATPGGYNIVGQSLTLVANTPHTMAVTLRGDVGGEVVWIMHTRDGVTYARTQCTLTTAEQIFVVAFTPTATAPNYMQIGVDLRDESQSAKPAETFYVGNSLVVAGTWTAAQILAEGGIPVTTATAASNPSAGKYWWHFGSAGVDDYMSAAFAPYQPTDDFVSIVGYRNQGSSAADYAFNVRGDGYKSAGGHYVALGKPGATWYDGTTTVSMESPTTIFTPIISTLAKRTNDRLFRINGAQVGATNTTALTPFTATHTYIGGSASGSAASPDTNFCFDGSISIVITASGSALTPADYPILERFAALFVPGIASF